MRDALKEAFPRLCVAVERLEADWADGPYTLGEYIVFEDVFGRYLDVLLAMPSDPKRDELLSEAFAFIEVLTSADDARVANLGVVALCERIPCIPGWEQAAEKLARPSTRKWLNWGFDPNELGDLIDLWGVREVIAAEGFDLPSLPGVSQPADHRRLGSLDEAQQHPEGVVMLSVFGTSTPLVVARASGVCSDPPTLDDLARALAKRIGGELLEPQGDPSAKYFSIPERERVWRMHRGDEEHGRLEDPVWMHPDLSRSDRRWVTAVLSGTAGKL